MCVCLLDIQQFIGVGWSRYPRHCASPGLREFFLSALLVSQTVTLMLFVQNMSAFLKSGVYITLFFNLCNLGLINSISIMPYMHCFADYYYKKHSCGLLGQGYGKPSV